MTAAVSYLVFLLLYLLPSNAFSSWSRINLFQSLIKSCVSPAYHPSSTRQGSRLPASVASSHSLFSLTQHHPVMLTFFSVPYMLFLPQDLCICSTLCLEHSLPSFSLADPYELSYSGLKVFPLESLSAPLPAQNSISLFSVGTPCPFCSMDPNL